MNTFEEWDKNITAKQYEEWLEHGVVAENAYNAGYEAATKAALGSRVVLPSEESVNDFISAASNSDLLRSVIHWYRDNIKLLPLTAEQVDEITRTNLTEVQEGYKQYAKLQTYKGSNLSFLAGVEWLRESIKKRLGAV